jgi:hypothetical protein
MDGKAGMVGVAAVPSHADADTLVKGTVIALDQTPGGLQLLGCGQERLVDDRHLGGMDCPAAAEPEPAKGSRRRLQGIEIPKTPGPLLAYDH